MIWNLKVEIKAFWRDENSDFEQASGQFWDQLVEVTGKKVLPQVNKEFSKDQKSPNMK